MRTHVPRGWPRLWLSIVFLASTLVLLAQPHLMTEEPQLLKLQVSGASLILDAEQKTETTSGPEAENRYKQDTSSLNPAVELGMQGSLYHPNFFDFNLLMRDGLYWEDMKADDGRDPYHRRGDLFVQNYDLNIAMLKEEPYAVSPFASRHILDRDYDFFTRVKVDSEQYGTRAGYNAGLIPFGVTVSHRDETVDDQARPSSSSDDTLSFSAQNTRGSDNSTTIDYWYDEFSRRDGELAPQEGREHSVHATDTERFGRENRSSLRSALAYNYRDYWQDTSESTGLRERLALQHSKTLHSAYDYTFDSRREGASSSDDHSGRVALGHKLYESLYSTFDVHGADNHASADDYSYDNRIYGVGIDEQYTKRLSTWGRLNLGYTGLRDRHEQSDSGAALAIVAESHVLTDGQTTFLNRARPDLATIRVMDSRGIVTYRESLDYLVIPRGDRVEIRRVTGGAIPNGGTVTVNYTAAAQPQATYDTQSDGYSARMEFLEGLLGVYGRLHTVRNDGAPPATAENVDDRTIGMDVSWGYLRAGAEYEDYESNVTPYRAIRFFQAVSCPIDRISQLGLDATETKSSYPDANREEESYQVIGRYHVRLLPSLGCGIEGGVHIDQGPGIDRNMKTARANLDFRVGQLSLAVSYDIMNEVYLDNNRDRQSIHVSAQRSF